MAQLALYHRMGCPSSLDTQPLYQRWLNERSAAESAAVGMAPQMEGIRYGDEVERGDSAPVSSLSGDEEKEEEQEQKKEAMYRCRRCRTPLATTAYLIPHTPPSPTSNTTPPSQNPRTHTHTPKQPCAHLFLDPLSWMRPELEKGNLEGRLECPKCGQNVGKYAWQGMRCSCGGWVVPGICLGRGRVDEVVGVGGKL